LPDPTRSPAFRFEPLGQIHDRDGFACGLEALDHYLQRQARHDVKKRVAAAFALTPDGKTLAGYYTLSQFSIHLDAIPDDIAGKLPQYPIVPATLIGRLAASANFRGQRLGEMLLMDALTRWLRSSSSVASAAVVVDAKAEQARLFYRQYRCRELPRGSAACCAESLWLSGQAQLNSLPPRGGGRPGQNRHGKAQPFRTAGSVPADQPLLQKAARSALNGRSRDARDVELRNLEHFHK
jgi:predicted GNAT family N-acyltransferase